MKYTKEAFQSKDKPGYLRNRIKYIGATGASALSLAGGVAGCGGENKQNTGEPLTRAEFAAQANQLCLDSIPKTDAVFAEIDETADARGLEEESYEYEDFYNDTANETIVPILQEVHDDMAKLNPPIADRTEVQEMVDAFQWGIDAIRENPVDARYPDGNTTFPFEPFRDLVREYGFDEYGIEDC